MEKQDRTCHEDQRQERTALKGKPSASKPNRGGGGGSRARGGRRCYDGLLGIEIRGRYDGAISFNIESVRKVWYAGASTCVPQSRGQDQQRGRGSQLRGEACFRNRSRRYQDLLHRRHREFLKGGSFGGRRPSTVERWTGK